MKDDVQGTFIEEGCAVVQKDVFVGEHIFVVSLLLHFVLQVFLSLLILSTTINKIKSIHFCTASIRKPITSSVISHSTVVSLRNKQTN